MKYKELETIVQNAGYSLMIEMSYYTGKKIYVIYTGEHDEGIYIVYKSENKKAIANKINQIIKG